MLSCPIVTTLSTNPASRFENECRIWPQVLERLKAYVSTEKRYTVTLKDENSET